MQIELWEAWLVIAITINTTINVLVFFGGRKIKGAGVSNENNSDKIYSERNEK